MVNSNGCIVLMLILSCASVGAEENPTTQPDRVMQWREDVRFLVAELGQRHIDPFTRISRADFHAAADLLIHRIPHLSDTQIHVELLKLIACIGDSHTTLSTGDFQPPLGRYPLCVEWFSDGIYIHAVGNDDHRDALAARLIAIGNVPIDEAVKRLSALFAHENETMQRRGVCGWMLIPEVLAALELIDDVNEATFVAERTDGRQVTLRLRPIDATAALKWVVQPEPGDQKRPALQRSRKEFYWFEYLPDLKTIYLRYDRCKIDPHKPIAEFSRELLEFIDANEVQRVVVDLRFNGGGNSVLFKPILLGLRVRRYINRDGGLVVLIGPGTYSSAMLNAWELKTQTHAILIGQPTSQKPNSFGEVRAFKLPNSRITVNYSTKRFNLFADADPPSFMPDVLIDPNSSDYFSGRDIVLENALAFERK